MTDALTEPVAEKQKRRARLTVMEQLCHQPGDAQPSADPLSFGRWLESDEMPFRRPRAKAAEEWKPLDCGWVETAGMLWVKNDGPGVLKLAYGDEPGWLVYPGESMRAVPEEAKNLRVRCVSGEAVYSITVIPG
jgi:hypothetical protein